MPQVAYELNKDGFRTKGGSEWTGKTVRDVLANQLYVGEYRVAGYSEQVDRYQLLSKSEFDAVQQVRNRFQRKNVHSKDPMPYDRKCGLVEGVIDEYLEYVQMFDYP
jgi:hypothetical protein